MDGSPSTTESSSKTKSLPSELAYIRNAVIPVIIKNIIVKKVLL
jgi:hypothetical protein